MIILSIPGGDRDAGKVVAIFGAGLIGHAIFSALMMRCSGAASYTDVTWRDSVARRDQFASIESRIAANLSSGMTLDVVWSAGRAGFLSPPEETAVELQIFRDVLEMSGRLVQSHDLRASSFRLVSSAGGLFEGQRVVTSSSVPAPRRPYGELKLSQERLLQSAPFFSRRRIDRVTSVYGRLRPGVRPGLVSKLVADALRRTTTHITGTISTLRDFVFVDDVAAYIAADVLDHDEARPEVCVLARARPCSLLEVQNVVEDVIGRKVYVSYGADRVNSEDITFSANAIPAGWRPSDLRGNIGTIYRAALEGSVDTPRAS